MDQTNERGDTTEDERGEPEWRIKQREFEQRKARVKLDLKTCTICGAENAKLCKGCGSVAYCSTACQRVDWRERGHRKACNKIRDERAAEAARAEAPPSPPRAVFYGPAPRSHADEVRARIAAEHETARALREANPEPEKVNGRYGSRCPICFDDWVNIHDVNIRSCCSRQICQQCAAKFRGKPCPLCRTPASQTYAEELARIQRHVDNDVPEAMAQLATLHSGGRLGLVKSGQKAKALLKRAVALGFVPAMAHLAILYRDGDGIKPDRRKAKRLFRAAADRGNANAQFQLARLLYYDNYQDSSWDMEDHLHWLRAAAAQRHAEAEYMLGCHSASGDGKPGPREEDLDECRRWLARAADHGDKKARYVLDRLTGVVDPGVAVALFKAAPAATAPGRTG